MLAVVKRLCALFLLGSSLVSVATGLLIESQASSRENKQTAEAVEEVPLNAEEKSLERKHDNFWTKATNEKKVTEIGQQLLKANEINEAISFFITYRRLDEPSNVGAYSDDAWGRVTVQSGLLDYISSDDELAAILSHEIAHILLRHGERLRWQKAPGWLLNTLASQVLGQEFPADWSAHYGTSATTQQFELLADKLGMQLMLKAGYAPEGMISILSKLVGDGYRASFRRTHPKGSGRIEAARKNALELRALAEQGHSIQLESSNTPTHQNETDYQVIEVHSKP